MRLNRHVQEYAGKHDIRDPDTLVRAASRGWPDPMTGGIQGTVMLCPSSESVNVAVRAIHDRWLRVQQVDLAFRSAAVLDEADAV